MRSTHRLSGLVLALALVASACGGADEVEDAADESQAGVDDDSVSDAMAMADDDADDGAAASGAPATMEEYEALWAEQRAEVVALLSSDEYGLGEDDILRGPGGFEVDLGRCPTNWSATEGVEGDTIKLAEVLPLSGPIADQGRMAGGMESYYAYVNENGGVAGKQIELVTRDGYEANLVVEAVDDLLTNERPFAVSTFGTPGTFAVADTLNQRCVPQPLVWTGHPAFGDPGGKPWTTGLPLSYQTEAVLWGNWIAQNVENLPVTVGALVMDNDFGGAYADTFAAWAADHPEVIAEFNPVRHDPATTDVSAELATITAGEPDVYISMTGGAACLLAVEAVAESGLAETAAARFTTSVCTDPSAYLAPAGDDGDGFLSVTGGTKNTTDSRFADDVFVSFAKERLEADGRETTVTSYGNGFGTKGWPVVEALRIAAELEGGLTRANYLLAHHALHFKHPYLVDGVAFSTNGAEDAYLIEGTEFARYDAANASWVAEGGVIDLDGLAGSCSWDGTSCS